MQHWIARITGFAVAADSAPTGCCAALLLGAVAGGGGYEVYQANEMGDLEEDDQAARISKEEYEARKKQIDDTSVFQ